jgi:hypothetical protein
MRISVLIILIPFLASSVFANSSVLVNSITALQTEINNATEGDTIILQNGIYFNNTISISNNNLTLLAQTNGGVFLNGSNIITISGNNNLFSGFQFTSGSISGIVIEVSGSHNTLSQLNFNGYSAQKYINIKAPGQFNIISYCNFENKPVTAPEGNLIHIGADITIPGFHKISHCSFQNITGPGGDNGNECIRLSNGDQSDYVAKTVVEYCYFENTGGGDSECISVKCKENTLRFNTFKNNQNAMMVFRKGNDNVAYGNFFINAGGIRVKEANNIFCYNNYFQNAGVNGKLNAITYDYIAPNLNNINFLFNTFIDCGIIDLSSGATNNTWANNIFVKGSGDIFTGQITGIKFLGNMFTGNPGVTIRDGMTQINPGLIINSSGFYELSAVSPAINASVSGFPDIIDISEIDDDPDLLFDFTLQNRPILISNKDVGCDEYSVEQIQNKPLSPEDVGPSYLRVSNSTQSFDINNNFQVLQNPFYDKIKISKCGENEHFFLYDMKNELLWSGENIDSQDFSYLLKGFYILKLISQEGKVFIFKLLKQ